LHKNPGISPENFVQNTERETRRARSLGDRGRADLVLLCKMTKAPITGGLAERRYKGEIGGAVPGHCPKPVGLADFMNDYGYNHHDDEKYEADCELNPKGGEYPHPRPSDYLAEFQYDEGYC